MSYSYSTTFVDEMQVIGLPILGGTVGEKTNGRGRPTIHDEPLQPAATRLPAAVIKWLLRRNSDNLSASMRDQLIEDYEREGCKNWASDDWTNE